MKKQGNKEMKIDTSEMVKISGVFLYGAPSGARFVYVIFGIPQLWAYRKLYSVQRYLS